MAKKTTFDSKQYEETNKLLQTQIDLAQQKGDKERQNLLLSRQYRENEEAINRIMQDGSLTLKEKEQLLTKIENNQKKINTQLDKEEKSRKRINTQIDSLNKGLAKSWEYLIQSDKTIRQTILSLGMSGAKAETMRMSFEKSARMVAQMGGNLGDVQSIMVGFADETGRARALSAEMVEDITAIGKGTGLGIEQATKLGAQFEFIGLDAKRSMDYVQGIVDTSERMGINTTKVLKNVSDNFKKLNTYSFTAGVKGMAKMAEDAEKMQVSMQDALSAADAAKGLEKAIDLAANLQVMGGEFAKTDPFEWMYLARNEPEKLTQKISEMTRGLVTFKKNSEGVFEKFISPADRQRLEGVAKSLGISNEEMVKITQRRADLDKMNQQLAGTGLSGREKELVEGAAIFNTKSGKFEVQLAGTMRDISTLTATQAKSFSKEQVLLKDRAVASQDFETAFKATLEEIKASLLPLLQGINKVLAFVRPIVSGFADLIKNLFDNKFGHWVGGFAAAVVMLNAVVARVTGRSFAERLSGRGAGGVGVGGRGFFGGKSVEKTVENALPTSGKGLSGLAEQRKGIGQGAAKSGSGMMRGGAGIGAAAAGAGAGIGAAAAGISLLATSMSKLDEKQAKILKQIVLILGGVMVVGMGAAVGIAAIGAAGGAVAVPLMAFGGAVALIGAGIGIAAGGIGLMGMGLAKMIDSSKSAGVSLSEVATGIGEIGLALAASSMGNIFGGGAMAIGLALIGKQAPAIAEIGEAFANIKAVLSGSKEDFVAVQNAISAIANTNVNAGGAFGQLAALLKTPLKVEFADKNVQLSSDVTLNIDGNKFMNKIFKTNTAITHQEELRTQSVNQ